MNIFTTLVDTQNNISLQYANPATEASLPEPA